MQTKRFFLSIFILLCSIALPVFAQEEEAVEDSTAWQTDLTAILAGSQASYDNWVEGGINSVAFTASLNGNANKDNRELDYQA